MDNSSAHLSWLAGALETLNTTLQGSDPAAIGNAVKEMRGVTRINPYHPMSSTYGAEQAVLIQDSLYLGAQKMAALAGDNVERRVTAIHTAKKIAENIVNDLAWSTTKKTLFKPYESECSIDRQRETTMGEVFKLTNNPRIETALEFMLDQAMLLPHKKDAEAYKTASWVHDVVAECLSPGHRLNEKLATLHESLTGQQAAAARATLAARQLVARHGAAPTEAVLALPA
jgi:hypothetical protein